ncbi:MAG: cytochrome c family protein [Gammaproteobacteria bacterium]|nr:cytochrome c family protein [Gammaproteobacteria bacterium]
MSTVMRYFALLCFGISSLALQAQETRIAQQLADSAPPVNPLREALGQKLYDEAMASGNYRYIGPRSCRVCHRDFYNGRQDDQHFHTFQKIVDAGYANEPKCLGCHTTGYGVPTGYTDGKKSAQLVGIECEGCHGPGNVHMRRNDGGGFLAGVDNPQRIERMCKACHTKRWNRAFPMKDFRQVYDGYVTAKPDEAKRPQQ